MNVLDVGTRGVGKSTLALYQAKQWGGTTIIFDPRGSYRYVGLQCPDVDTLMQHLETADYVDPKTGEALPLVYHVDADPVASFDDLCGAIFPPRFEGFQGRVALIVDESRNLQSPHFISPSLDRVVGQAPINDVLIIQTTHEIKEWNSKSKSVMDEMFLFYQKGPANRRLIAEYCGEEVAEIVCDQFRPSSDDDPKKHYLVRYSYRRMFESREWEVWQDSSVWHSELGQHNRLPGNQEKFDSDEREDDNYGDDDLRQLREGQAQ